MVRTRLQRPDRIVTVIVHESLATGQDKNKREEKQPEKQGPSKLFILFHNGSLDGLNHSPNFAFLFKNGSLDSPTFNSVEIDKYWDNYAAIDRYWDRINAW